MYPIENKKKILNVNLTFAVCRKRGALISLLLILVSRFRQEQFDKLKWSQFIVVNSQIA